ncbi:MAG: NAD-dependent epimerase/dehydratase family protein [Candidatus Omnitrophica bacterium]|nr:NAD-dependent epimerase/dehydratase family protein [Candidatus Omnitrophota bacterium]
MILVTGATGYIGRRLIRLLCAEYPASQIVCLVRPQTDSDKERSGRGILQELKVGIVQGDLLNISSLKGLPQSPKLLFHLASCTDTSVKDHSVNDVGTRNLLQAVGPMSRTAHMVFTSSIAVNDGRADCSRPMVENDRVVLKPRHVYGRRKLLAEEFLMEQAAKQSFSLSVIRVCGVYGYDAIEKGLYMSLRRLVLNNSWLARLDWPGRISSMYVEDVSWFIHRVSQCPPPSGRHELYIPSAEALTVGQMCASYATALGQDYQTLKVPALVWQMMGWILRRHHVWEKILPHKFYNMIWQANILVSQGYWNESVKLEQLAGDRNLTRFEEFCRMDDGKLQPRSC